MTDANWLQKFPGLARLSPDLRASMVKWQLRDHAPEREPDLWPRSGAGSLPAAARGTVRVQQVSEGGREIVLYRVTAGESCALDDGLPHEL